MRNFKIRLAVVIINYKTPELVINCLETLLPELDDLATKVVIIDNNSNDDSCETISHWLSRNDSLNQVKLISSQENSGFSGGNNRGICEVEAEYYLLLNSDTLIRKGAIALLLGAADKDKQAGLISPRLEWPDGTPQESCFKFHTPISELISSANTGVVTRLFQKFNVPQPVSEQSSYYDWTSFACVLVKAEVFKDIGLMDDGYFMYYEDVAFAYKAKQEEWKVLNVPDAHVVHLRGGSSPVKSQAKLRKRLPRYYYESRTRYFFQRYGHVGLFSANLFWALGWGISSLRQLISPTFAPAISDFQWRDIWMHFTNPERPYIHPDNYDKT